jgi:hypothetical protein
MRPVDDTPRPQPPDPPSVEAAANPTAGVVPEGAAAAAALRGAAGTRDRGMARAAGVISAATFLSRVLGLVREQVFAAQFGAGFSVDAFQVAFRVPNLLRDLFAEGAMSAAFVPTLTRTEREAGPEAAMRLANLVINFLLVAVSALCLVGILAAPWIVRYLDQELPQSAQDGAEGHPDDRLQSPARAERRDEKPGKNQRQVEHRRSDGGEEEHAPGVQDAHDRGRERYEEQERRHDPGH